MPCATWPVTEGPRAGQLLADAVAAYTSALQVFNRDQTPEGWANTQNGRGIALDDLAKHSEGPLAHQLLADAVAAYNLALEVRTRDRLPRDWATTQNNLGGPVRNIVST